MYDIRCTCARCVVRVVGCPLSVVQCLMYNAWRMAHGALRMAYGGWWVVVVVWWVVDGRRKNDFPCNEFIWPNPKTSVFLKKLQDALATQTIVFVNKCEHLDEI